MNKFKGTPGPWKWNGEDYRGDWGWQILVGPEGQGVVIGEGPKGMFKGLKAHEDIDANLCKTGFNAPENGAPGVHVRYHNAQLIAAAPELLEALQLLMAEQTGGNKSCGHNGFTCMCPYDKARAAIAKALGESK